jgi:hypothetical protein
MKKISVALLLFCSATFVQAQDKKDANFEALMTPQQLVSTMRGNQLPTGGKNIRTVGSAYLNDNWAVGSITTTMNQEFKDVMIKYNAYSDEVLFRKSAQDKDSMWLYKPQVKTLNFTIDNVVWKFAMEQLPDTNEKSYVRVLHEGKVSFLAKYVKIFYPADAQGGYSNRPDNTLEEEVTYFLKLANGKIIKVSRKKGSFLDALQDQKDKLKDFIKTQKIDFDKDADVQKLLEYYAGL